MTVEEIPSLGVSFALLLVLVVSVVNCLDGSELSLEDDEDVLHLMVFSFLILCLVS